MSSTNESVPVADKRTGNTFEEIAKGQNIDLAAVTPEDFFYEFAPEDTDHSGFMYAIPTQINFGGRVFNHQENGALIHPGTTVDVLAKVGSRSIVMADELVGHTVIGPSVIVGMGAKIKSSKIGEAVGEVAKNVVIQPWASIENSRIKEGAKVGQAARISGSEVQERAVIGEFTVIELGSLINRGAFVGNSVHIMEHGQVGEGATVEKYVVIEQYGDVRSNARVGEGSELEHGGIVGEGAVVGFDVTVGIASEIMRNAVVKGPANLGERVSIGEGTTVDGGSVFEDYSSIGPWSEVGKNVRFPERTSVGEHSRVMDGTTVPEGEKIKPRNLVYPGERYVRAVRGEVQRPGK